MAQMMEAEAAGADGCGEDSSDDDFAESDEAIRRELARVRDEDGHSDGLAGTGVPATNPELEHIQNCVMNTCLREMEKLKPGPGRGRSELNAAASNKRRAHVHPGGIYEAWSSQTPCPFRRNTGMERHEFDAFYVEIGGDTGHLFRTPRNHQGRWTPSENDDRRRIRGTLRYRDRVLCWLMMLRTGCHFHQMQTLFGPGESTFCRDLLWMTIQATTLPCLVNVSWAARNPLLYGQVGW